MDLAGELFFCRQVNSLPIRYSIARPTAVGNGGTTRGGAADAGKGAGDWILGSGSGDFAASTAVKSEPGEAAVAKGRFIGSASRSQIGVPLEGAAAGRADEEEWVNGLAILLPTLLALVTLAFFPPSLSPGPFTIIFKFFKPLVRMGWV